MEVVAVEADVVKRAVLAPCRSRSILRSRSLSKTRRVCGHG
jgi:hypothetical protein